MTYVKASIKFRFYRRATSSMAFYTVFAWALLCMAGCLSSDDDGTACQLHSDCEGLCIENRCVSTQTESTGNDENNDSAPNGAGVEDNANSSSGSAVSETQNDDVSMPDSVACPASGSSCESICSWSAQCIADSAMFPTCGNASRGRVYEVCANACVESPETFEDICTHASCGETLPYFESSAEFLRDACSEDVSESNVEVCARCTGDMECAAIGAGAKCEAFGEGAYCFASCAGGIECPAGFACRPNVDLCVPTNGTCDVCPGKPCAPGLVCDLDQNECVAERMLCERCFGPDSCVDGAECVTVDERDVCVKPCMDGMCDTGSVCENGHCIPSATRCDPCGQSCGGQTPVCVESLGVCGQCSPDVPCGLGEYCNETNWLCEVATMCDSCTSDESCGTCTGRPYCVGNECVVCLQDTDCPPRFTCSADFACESSPCGGVTCQSGTTCDPAQGGLCVKADGTPGCTSAADCGLPELQCNVSTGQCYYPDGQCDPGGENGVCMPGGICQMDGARGLFLGVQTPIFTCVCNPDLSAQTVCHPGQTCAVGLALTGENPPSSCFQ